METEIRDQFLKELAKLLKKFNADLELNDGHGHRQSSIDVYIRDEEGLANDHFTLPTFIDGDY